MYLHKYPTLQIISYVILFLEVGLKTGIIWKLLTHTYLHFNLPIKSSKVKSKNPCLLGFISFNFLCYLNELDILSEVNGRWGGGVGGWFCFFLCRSQGQGSLLMEPQPSANLAHDSSDQLSWVYFCWFGPLSDLTKVKVLHLPNPQLIIIPGVNM